MSGDVQQTETREAVEAGALMVFMGVCLGGLGIVLAAIAVGAERAWNDRERGSAAATQRAWRNTLADHRAWLDMDRQRRDTYRQARRDWWANGAKGNPPPRPARSVRAGSWLRRTWARTAVAAHWLGSMDVRFGEGFREGFETARQARRDGAGWRETARTRPGSPNRPVEVETPDPEPVAEPATDPTVPSHAADDSPASDTPDPAPDHTPREDQPLPVPVDPQPAPAATKTSTPAQPEQQQEEQDMTTATTTGQPTSETHLDHAILGLGSVQTSIVKIHELNDAVAAEKNALAAKVMAERERLGNKGTAAALQALDEADALVVLMGQQIAATADAATQVDDQANAALAGLQPAANAQDELHSSGATGELVSAATSD
jgi:hypothetical protein